MPTPSALQEIYLRTARQGNTRALVDVARALGATVIVHDEPFAQRLKSEGVRAVSVEGGAMRFAGTTGPYVVDLPVLGTTAQAWDRDIARANNAERIASNERARADGAEAREERLRRENARLHAEIRDLSSEVERLRAIALVGGGAS